MSLLTFHVYRVTYYLITEAFDQFESDDDDNDDDVAVDNDNDDDEAVQFSVFSDTRHNSRKFAGRAGLFCRRE